MDPPARYRHTTDNLKAQAARFRLFRCVHDPNRLFDAAGVRLDDLSSLTWAVHLGDRNRMER
jgi:hypothetical protein